MTDRRGGSHSEPFLAGGAASIQRCAACGSTLPETDASVACRSCGGLLEIVHAAPELHGAALMARFAQRRGTHPGSEPSGVWQFRELVMPSAVELVSYPEGHTPLVDREGVRTFAGVATLHLKHEGLNPTGSFKDRGMTVALTQAKRIGARAVVCASTGNPSASLAAYAANAGIPALVLVPKGQIAMGKLTQTLAYGAKTLLVDGDFDACLRLVREASEKLGVYLVNSINPWRIEGQKTIIFELLQQFGWETPGWIAFPAGNLGNTSAFGKALREAHALGLIAKVPRLLAVQAAGAAPFAHAFANGFTRREVVKPETIATAIRIGDPASWDRAVIAIRETNGAVTAVTDAEILEAKAVIDASGIGCEPASAAALAGVRQLCARGTIAASDAVVCVLTGHLLKDPDTVMAYHGGTLPHAGRRNRIVEIPAELGAIERILLQF